MSFMMNFMKFIFILFLGFFMGTKYDDSANRSLSLEKKVILKELVTLANVKINEVRCELYNYGSLIKEPLVSDYLVEYLSFSYSQDKNHDIYFACDEDNKCHFSFGLKKWKESYNKILSFSYNKEKRVIDSKSFSCVDVP